MRLGALFLLAEGPLNGYGVIRGLADRSGGTWTPSSGAVYPALAQLEDEGLIEPDTEAGPKHFRLTDAGRTEVDSLGDRSRPWEQASEEATHDLGGTAELWEAFGQAAMAVRAVVQSRDETTIARTTEELVALRRRLYGLLAEGGEARSGRDPDQGDEEE